MVLLETPSRVWRRIDAAEGADMPSLPSLPAFDDSADNLSSSSSNLNLNHHQPHNLSTVYSQCDEEEEKNDPVPVHSTPAAAPTGILSHTSTSTGRFGGVPTSSTAKFASSIESRSTNGNTISVSHALSSVSRATSASVAKGAPWQESFDVSAIPSIPDRSEDGLDDLRPPEDGEQELLMAEALEPVSRVSSPFPLDEDDPEYGSETAFTPKKNYDYSVSLRMEPKPSPFDKFRNVALRKPSTHARNVYTRTPSLSRTTSPSATSSSSLDSEHEQGGLSPASVPLPPSNVGSPALAGVVVRYGLEEGGELEGEPDLSELQDSTADLQEGLVQEQEHDPTFSSESSSPPPATTNPNPNNTRPHSPASSSPAASLAFTPTPANPPRVRPRPWVRAGARAEFPLPVPALDAEYREEDEDEVDADERYEYEGGDGDGEEEGDYEPLTPHTRRRSFLMDIINSTSRPRMKFPTPHPRYSNVSGGGTPEGETSKSGEGEGESTLGVVGARLRTAFAGATPRHGRRAPHPLSQTFVPPTSEEPHPANDIPTPLASSGLHLSSLQTPTTRFLPDANANATPASHDSDRSSFVSTASSHDLTTHAYARANASFDPIMGMGLGERGGGVGVGRFNAGKLNAYLHGLNRRLAEENEGLVGRLRRVEEERGAGGYGRRLSGGARGRRVSAAGSALGDVEEDVGAEGWVEEKRELEEMVEMLTGEVNRCNEAKEEVDRALAAEKVERGRDKERWKERMGEVERGVEGIVNELEQKATDAERNVKEVEKKLKEGEQDIVMMERALESVEEERDVANQRAEKAEKMLGDGRELGGELKEANDRVAQVEGELRNANSQIRGLEDEVIRSDERLDVLEKELKEEKAMVSGRDRELVDANKRFGVADKELKASKEYIAALEADAGAAMERIESLEEQLASADKRLRLMDAQEEKLDQLEMDAATKNHFIGQLEEAVEGGKRRLVADEEKIAKLEGRIVSLEAEKQRQRENKSLDLSRSHMAVDADAQDDIEALESELDDANREIARLNTLLNQSPARRAIHKVKDAKIEMLEKEKEDLLERVKMLRNTMNEMGSPNRFVSGSGISPIHRQVLSMSIRGPRTPGAPLREMSWLNNSAADSSVSPLIAEINRLQSELDRANESIDDKLDKLEDAGLGVVGLTKKLEDARSRIITLEDEIARLSRREDRRIRRLERVRCQKCHIKVDLRGVMASAEADESSFEITTGHLPSEPPTPPTKTSEALRANLQSVNTQLDTMKKQWETEKKQLLGEKAVLQDVAKRLNLQVRSVKEEVKTERAKAGSQGELERAKEAITDLETALQVERSRLRSLTGEQSRIQRQKNDVLLQLQRTEADMDDVKSQLQKFKQENHELEAELRRNATAEQKARLLEVRVTENADTIEQLRQERSLLVSDHKALQKRFSEISERASKLRDEHAVSQLCHDNRRHQLDLHLLEVDDLRRALSNQADELQKTEEEKNRIASQKSDVARTVALLESDLKRVRRDAEAFGRDLKHLRVEKERWDGKQKDEATKAERARKQSQTQIRLLNEQLEGQREKAKRAKEDLRNHVCAPLDDGQLSAMKIQHNKECKGLIVQIRYLKAKFTRESTLRFDLGYQKQYLLVLLTKFEKSEQRILTSIAKIGYPAAPPKPRRRTRSLKSAALSVVFILRAKRASDLWREQNASKTAIAAALQDVRRRRAVAAS